jgi:hypothetical protein
MNEAVSQTFVTSTKAGQSASVCELPKVNKITPVHYWYIMLCVSQQRSVIKAHHRYMLCQSDKEVSPKLANHQPILYMTWQRTDGSLNWNPKTI